MFIVIEGGKSSGKTTLKNLLIPWLEEKGLTVFDSTSPTDWAKTLEHQGQFASPRSEMFLELADRAEQFEKIIKPALDKNFVVILENYKKGFLAKYVLGEGENAEMVQALNNKCELPSADVTLILNPEASEVLKRNPRLNVAKYTRMQPNFIETEEGDSIITGSSPQEVFENAKAWINEAYFYNEVTPEINAVEAGVLPVSTTISELPKLNPEDFLPTQPESNLEAVPDVT